MVLAAAREEDAERVAVRVDEADPEIRGQAQDLESRRSLPEHLVDPLAEPVEALRLRALDEPGPHDQHVVVRLAEACRAARARARAAGA